MTDKKKPTIQFGDYSKDFLEAFEKETERLIAEQSGVKKDSEPKKLSQEEQKDLLESLKQLDEVERTQPKRISENKMNEYLTTLRDIDAKQRNIDNSNSVTEGDLLGGTDNPVTQSQLRQATGELFARVQTSLASVGGGGLGTIMQGVEGNPADGQLPMYDAATGDMVWATVFGVGEAYADSDALSVILDTVDSAYVQARQTGAGLDSTQIINLITGTVDSNYVAARDSDLVGSFYTTADHDSDTLVQVDSAYINARSNHYTTPDHDSDTLVQVDSAYVQARQLVYGDADVRSLLAGDSGVFNIIPAADSTYDLGDSNIRWRDLYLSGQTIYLGSQAIQSRTDGVYANGKKLGFADSAYTTANHDSDTLVQVDSAYVRARQIRTLAGLDDTQIDSATIAADDFLRWNGTDWIAAPFNVDPGLSFNGSIDATVGGDSAPSVAGGSLYVNTASGVVGTSYTGIAGDSIDSGQAIAYAESDGVWHILGSVAQASVVEVRQGDGISIDDSNPARPIVAINRVETDTWYLDSARTIAMIDSDYVEARVTHYTTADHDSDTLIQVDSAYVQARQIKYLDSAQITNLIDSAYVQARDSDGGFYTTADHDSDTLVQVDSAYVQARQLLGSSVTVDSVAPSPATNGELWYDPTTSVLHIRDSGEWDSINAQDSGAYLLLTGGTITGPLNIDSAGVQLGPEGYRLKLIAGAYTRVETWTSGASAWDSAVGGGAGVPALAYDPDTNILIAASRAGETIWWSDDKGVSWNRSTDSAGNPWIVSTEPFSQIRNAYYIPEVKRWFAGDTKFNALWISDNGKDNWIQPAFDSVNSTELETSLSSYEIDVIYDDSLNPVMYGMYGGTTISRSFDSGSTWSIVGHDDIGFDPLRNKAGKPFYSKSRRLSKVAAVVDDSSGPDLMYSSTDGRNWTKLADSSPGQPGVTKLFTLFDSDLDTVINVGEDENTYWSDDFGVTWNLSKIIGTNDSGEFDLRVYDITKTETDAYYALAYSGYGNGGYTSTDLKEWHLVDRHVGIASIDGVVHLGGGEYVRATDANGENIETAVFNSSTVDIGTLNFDGKRVMLETDMDSEHAWNIAEHSKVESNLQSLIDSDHAWANETFYDSVAIKNLIDSGYVQARVAPGTYVAGGRFIVNTSFTHDSSDPIPSRLVKSLFGIRDITREEAGLYTLTFDSAVNAALQDSYSYIVTTSIDYNADNPTASTRNVAVYDQDSNKFSLLMERADDGVNQDYGTNDAGARINFTVVKAD